MFLVVSEQKIAQRINGHLGNPIIVLDETGSTNELAKTYAKEGATQGTVLIARRQTAGKGRMGRSFYSPDSGLYMTVILRPKITIERSLLLTSMAGVAVVRTIRKLTGFCAKIKWVNDIYLDGKKLAGILAESALNSDGTIRYMVLGIGINVHTKSFPEEIAKTVTSLSVGDHAAQVDINYLAAQILNELSGLYGEQMCNRAYLAEYREYSCVLGRTVKMIQGDQEEMVLAVGITDDAGLIVRRTDGSEIMLNSGEISLRGDFK